MKEEVIDYQLKEEEYHDNGDRKNDNEKNQLV